MSPIGACVLAWVDHDNPRSRSRAAHAQGCHEPESRARERQLGGHHPPTGVTRPAQHSQERGKRCGHTPACVMSSCGSVPTGA